MDYQLIDCGNGYKIEQFSKYIIARPEPQAFWELKQPLSYWYENVDAFFERKKSDVISNKEDSGSWIKKDSMPSSFSLSIGKFGSHQIEAKLSLTSFKHLGIFPEQFSNWEFLHQVISKADLDYPMLNLFAYTGIASVVSAAAGIQVVHVDSVKQVVNWCNENRILSGVEPKIAWVIEDAMKYLRREVNREKKYSVIVLDPPAYGRGANGEKWVLEKEIFELLRLCKLLLAPKKSVLVINLYSMNISPVLLQNILVEADLWNANSVVFEQYIPYNNNKNKLPLGICGRIINP
jgi:23S rRNA (cytosine1962-C5)-methyltransferase